MALAVGVSTATVRRIRQANGILTRDRRRQPRPGEIHRIADNYATHKTFQGSKVALTTPSVPYALHAGELGSIWWSVSSGTSQTKRIRRDVFRDVEELIVAIEHYIDQSGAQALHMDGQSSRHLGESSVPAPS
jgi:hypothetical protein